MATRRQEELVEQLPEDLRKHAVDLSGEGSAEYAFPRDCAGEVFAVLAASGVGVLGGDLWRKDEEGFASCHDGWFTEGSDPLEMSRKWQEFYQRIPAEPGYYVTFVA